MTKHPWSLSQSFDPYCVNPSCMIKRSKPFEEKEMKKLYRCRVCGYILERANPPDVCPACGVKGKIFEEYDSPVSQKRRKLLHQSMNLLKRKIFKKNQKSQSSTNSIKNKKTMIIHCLSCGKTTSNNLHRCPYCAAEISDLTLELNGIDVKPSFRDKVMSLMFAFVRQ